MPKWLLLIALLLGGYAASSSFALEELVRSTLTIYFIIAGFLILIFHQRAWEFLRPLVVIGAALLFLPPLFENLMHDLLQRLPSSFGFLSFHRGAELWWIPIIALGTFLLWRLAVWYWRRPRRELGRVLRERERVLPRFDFEDE